MQLWQEDNNDELEIAYGAICILAINDLPTKIKAVGNSLVMFFERVSSAKLPG